MFDKYESWVIVDERGRVTIPAKVRESMRLISGRTVVKISYEFGEIKITNREEKGEK